MSRSAIFGLLLTAASAHVLGAQNAQAARDSAAASEIMQLEYRIEAATTRATPADSAFLDSVYATDFRFKHASGQLQNRAQVLAVARRVRFAARDLDSVDVELHGDVALTTGRIHVRRRPGAPPTLPPRYTIRYVRVYAHRGGRWRLLTDHSTGETPDSGASAALDSITLERSACYGTCPAYRLTLSAAGTVIFVSRNNGDTAHAIRDSIAPSGFAWLRGEAEHGGLSRVPAIVADDHVLCPGAATDHSTVTVTLYWATHRQQIVDYQGCFVRTDDSSGARLAALRRFEAAMDSVASTSRWIRPNRLR